MTDQAVETYSGAGRLGVGSCAACNLLWFDQSGSIGLTPRAVLGLFQYIGTAAGAARTPLASTYRCSRCSDTLALTYDLQRSTRFTYWRCANDHGQLFTFNMFLREKNFIRSPTLAELNKLRETVRQISCSQCGGPIDLSKDTACTHCGAPIALIDPDGVAKAVHDLTMGPASTSPATQEQTSVALSNLQLDAFLDQGRSDESEGNHDLLAIGVAAIGAALGAMLLAR
jgi:DNA-directed RNA polymerase subunit RPC12/RpoP